jgi:hypothetical protein
MGIRPKRLQQLFPKVIVQSAHYSIRAVPIPSRPMKRPCYTKSDRLMGDGSPQHAARGRAQMPGRENPGAAAHHVTIAVFRRPGGSVGWCGFMTVVPAVFDPLGRIAVHLIESPRVRGEGIDRNCHASKFASAGRSHR